MTPTEPVDAHPSVVTACRRARDALRLYSQMASSNCVGQGVPLSAATLWLFVWRHLEHCAQTSPAPNLKQ
jgi:hypothetical protein